MRSYTILGINKTNSLTCDNKIGTMRKQHKREEKKNNTDDINMENLLYVSNEKHYYCCKFLQ